MSKKTKPVYIDPDLHKEVKIEATKDGKSIREWIEDMLRKIGIGRPPDAEQE